MTFQVVDWNLYHMLKTTGSIYVFVYLVLVALDMFKHRFVFSCVQSQVFRSTVVVGVVVL